MDTVRLTGSDALIIVDVQNDFLPGGRLAVPNGHKVVPVLNRYIEMFTRAGQPVYATRDWHPADHSSFTKHGGIWPVHCVQESKGAEFAPGLALPPDATIVSKAATREIDAYSGFEGTGLADLLRTQGIERVFVGGLATDYCVLNTAKDALAQGFTVHLLLDAIGAVDVRPGDGDRAINEMIELGVRPLRIPNLAQMVANPSGAAPFVG